MPMLPSGRHIAVQATGFDTLYDEAFNGTQAHKLMQIKTITDLYPYVEVIYFVHELQNNNDADETESQDYPTGLRPVGSGYSLVSIQDEVRHWSKQDQVAFEEYLTCERTQAFFAGLLEDVKEKQEALLKAGPELGRFLAMCWVTGAHPLQEGE